MNRTSSPAGEETVHVSLGDRSYDIAIGAGLLADTGRRLKPHLRRPVTAIVTDANLERLHLKELQKSLNNAGVASTPIVLPPGEPTKSYQSLATLCDRLLAAGIERRDTIVALGGGVIGDLAGFAAAILRRGIDFIQIPTTLLAQVDSSIGGKTGINSPLGKNLIGAFHQPKAVLADIALLDTLPPRELRAGYAEVVKYGLLGDAPFFTWLETAAPDIFAGDRAARIRAIRVCCEAKARIVAEDESETGIRALLNLGHTFAHALEAATGYGERLLHGEAVAIGMAMAFRFSEMLEFCPPRTSGRVEEHLKVVGLPSSLADIQGDLPAASELLAIMRRDKKAQAGKLTFILVRAIGEAFIARDIADDRALAFLTGELAKRRPK
jgi:3-dehydroquinate synthase